MACIWQIIGSTSIIAAMPSFVILNDAIEVYWQ